MQSSSVAYIGLGSNLDNPMQQIINAIREINTLPNTHMLTVSSLYESEPMGPRDQPNFVNAVAKIQTKSSPHALLSELQVIEKQHKRERLGLRWGPRTLDLDILLYGDQIIDDQHLIIPHPRIWEREFVLIPLQEMDPTLIIPKYGSVSALIDKLPVKSLKKMEDKPCIACKPSTS